MKLKRLVDNKPAYTAGKEYKVISYANGKLRVANDMNSSFLYCDTHYYLQEINGERHYFSEIWEKVE